MTDETDTDEQAYERHQRQVSESVDGGGCAETWETLSEQRRPDEDATQQDTDIEEILLDLDCLQFSEDGEDFELEPSFRHAWQSAIDDLGENLDAVIADVFTVDGTIEIETTEGAVHVRHDERLLGQWVSHPALIADLAACHVFAHRDDDWAERAPAERSRFAGSARLYLDFCPDCGGDASFDTDVVSSCCHDYEVATVSCEGCDVTLFELPVARNSA
ncbi:hypothetical protein HLRTI_003355 [Halorhabdus tiamatea SARL4B]|uniref:Uncharacterized protein n=1 Tax=Halorhabdus tiamatea SARL4B TaxID=1033806 RepID=F7PQM1_9EURY|nr:hypothetical protein [Halorhabdus tiamatea]ERJ04668.1 hypothetical protein HLRTI_003355 [Halorhabdus tiamatea SARL4B]CCQ32322.1 conserved hypothetical protein [Halorhabdus tiamatea SARL4B]